MRADIAGDALAGDAAHACADLLDRHHQREAEQHHPAHRVAELRAGLRVGGDAARIVVGGAGDQSRAEPAEQPLVRCCGGRRGAGRCGPPIRESRRRRRLCSSFRRCCLRLHQTQHAHPHRAVRKAGANQRGRRRVVRRHGAKLNSDLRGADGLAERVLTIMA